MEEKSLQTKRKILVMTESYPFFLVGILVSSDKEYINVKAEFGIPLPLRDRVFHIRKDAISAFFIENDECKIPTVW